MMYKKFKTTVAGAYDGNAMGADTIQKTRASQKSLMSMKKFLNSIFSSAIIAALVLSAVSCEKDDVDFTWTGEESVVINGVKWATRNVDDVGNFAASPEKLGMLYQWNRKVAYSAKGEVADFDKSIPAGSAWTSANDPSPAGWRVPTYDELKSLLDKTKVRHQWISYKGVHGRLFTDRNSGKSLFLPAAGFRDYRTYSEGTLSHSDSRAYYWSATQSGSKTAYYLWSYDNYVSSGDDTRRYAQSIRCVQDDVAE